MMTDFNGYSIWHGSLCCDDCDIELMPVVGKVSVSMVLRAIGEHDEKEHND